METFQKEVTYLGKVYNTEKATFEEGEIKKTATFKELNRKDPDQHKLHFKIISIFENFGVKDDDVSEDRLKIDSDGMYDLTVKAIKTLIQIGPDFTAADKTEFLSDSGAILQFGFWLLGEKIAPFFSTFKMT